jgi:hypothetical protein
MLSCCGTDSHPWDQYQAAERWMPRTLRCLIIGESPGDLDSEYFYTAPKDYDQDRVAVRRCLLRGLHQHELISQATLEVFRDAGFLFDHAIRCPLPPEIVNAEREAAMRYASQRVLCPNHLRRILDESPVVWVMGHLASNAVANIVSDFQKVKRRVSQPPFPSELTLGSKFFLSEYLTRRNENRAPQICEAFVRFARARGIFT